MERYTEMKILHINDLTLGYQRDILHMSDTGN